mgnify:CR=1 FL=1
MSWIHSSKGVVLGVLLAVSLVAVGTAAAATVSGSAPAATAEGETVSTTATVEEPFRDMPDQWTLQGTTDLENASWTVTVSAQGDEVDTQSFSGGSFTYDLDRQTGATTVEIDVTGEVPALNTFDYGNPAAENYTAASVGQSSGDTMTAMATFEGHRYTSAPGDAVGSQEARAAIDEAVESAGEDNGNVQQAISAYNNGNFENAVSLAEDAESGAQTSQLLMIGAGVVVVLLLVGGGVYYWRQNRDKGHKLQ